VERNYIKVGDISLFRMNKYYTGYPEIEYCYKVNFDFGLNPSDCVVMLDKYKPEIREEKLKQLCL
jgi:hypothetical protein